MSSKLRIKVKDGFYKGIEGILIKKIPGGNFFTVKLDDGRLTALHTLEFERLPNNHLLHNEKT